MDPETQRLIEKTRQRREMLNQRIAGMPEAAPRKRRTPVYDEQESENILTEKQVNQDGNSSHETYDSPKRQCVREQVQEKKQDTPAIRGVQSRIKDLPNSLTRENEENVEVTPTPKPRKSVSSPPLARRTVTLVSKSPVSESVASVSSSRKGRFAALASNINNWEDDLTHHVIQKEEEKKPKWQPPAKASDSTVQVLSASSGKGPAPAPPHISSNDTSKSVVARSPLKVETPTPASAPVAAAAGSLTRNSPLRSSSKVEWNRSPKPFSPSYKDNISSPSKSVTELARNNSPKKQMLPVKDVSETAVSSSGRLRSGSVMASHTTTLSASTKPNCPITNSVSLNEAPASDSVLNTTRDEPTLRPVSQRLASWAQKVDVPKPQAAEPSRQPLSAKLASFEKKITQGTPKTSQKHFALDTPKKMNTPVKPSPALAATSLNNARSKECDPAELPVSQRMYQMQQKLNNTPQISRQQEEPTAFSVGARMSAWETMTVSNLVSDIKKVNPTEGTPQANKPRPVSEFAPKTATLTSGSSMNIPLPPPPPGTVNKPVSAKKSLRECIEEKASQVLARQVTRASSVGPAPAKAASSVGPAPAKAASSVGPAPAKAVSPVKTVTGSPSRVIHSPSKVSTGTKTVQQLLVERVQDGATTCSSLAAQSRAARFEELKLIQNRWKNGVLRDDNSSSDESSPQSEQAVDSTRGRTPQKLDMGGQAAVSSRREESRTRARTEFNQKLAEIGLGGSEVSSPAAPPLPPPPKAASTASSNQTSSIYNLIKKREDTVSQSTGNKKVKFDDSFDDTDDDSQRKIPQSAMKRQVHQLSTEDQDFKKPQVPKLKDESDSDVISSSDVGDEEFGPSHKILMDFDDDDISLKDFVSEAVRRESILPAAKPQGSSQSSLDSYDDDHFTADSEGSAGSSAKPGGYQPDDDSANESDDRQAVDNLLDEAFSSDNDSDVVPRNMASGQRSGQDPGYDPDMDINNVVMRKKVNSRPVPAQRSHVNATDSSDEDSDNRPYSLESYRKSAHVHQHVMEPVIRKSRYADAHVEEEDVPTVQQPRRDDKRAVLDRIRELQELVQQEQSVIMQTSNALNKCCVGNSYFAGSSEQVECNRVLLLACQKRQCYMTEIQRLKESGVLSHDGPGPQGSLTISDIRLPLKKEFVTRIGTSQDTSTHYFIILIRNGPQLICTQMLSTHDPMMRGSLDFPNLIKINGITANFKLTLDIYSLSVSREMSTKEKKRKTPKKGKGYAMALESPGGPTAVRTTSFSQVTSMQLSMKCLDKNSFHLDRLPHLSPLYGQIFMRLKCLMEANVEERGFLTMFEDVSGFGAWHRRWCVLAGNKICVWKYPDDETRKDPMTIIDLKRCITEKVGLVPRDICARPNTFELTTVRQPLKGEHDTLVTRTHNSTTSVRQQMSADSKEERIMWCNKINRTLANLRTWNADALKPSRPSCAPSSPYR